MGGLSRWVRAGKSFKKYIGTVRSVVLCLKSRSLRSHLAGEAFRLFLGPWRLVGPVCEEHSGQGLTLWPWAELGR